MQERPTEQLAEFLLRLRYEDIPPDVIAQAKRCIQDHLGVVLVGSTLPWTQIVYRYVQRFARPGQSTVVNFGTQYLHMDTACANAVFAQGCELDEYGSGHTGAVVVPTALALAEATHCSGREFIASVVAGYDATGRIHKATEPSLLRRGFQPCGTLGPFGAAAVAGRAFGLSPMEMMHALGIAASHASGLTEYDQTGGEVKRLHAGLAARSGIESALLAREGLTGPPTAIEGKRGFCHAFSDTVDAGAITQDLGRQFAIMDVRFKFYPVVGGLQGPLFALQQLVEAEGVRGEDVQEVHYGVEETTLAHGGSIVEPTDCASAQFSLAFSTALRLIRGSNDLALYRDPACWEDETLLNMARRVHLRANPLTEVEIVMRNGRTHAATLAHPKGSRGNPCTDEDLEAKFRPLAASVMPTRRIDELLGVARNLENLDDAANLAALLVAPAG